MTNTQFEIPIVLFLFKRKETTLKIIEVIKKVNPKKIYLLSDAGRNENEQDLVNECRIAIENAIDWNCEIIKNYASKNRGVYENIGLGSKWVFEREEKAIFLEDDSLPDISFFSYCEELLEYYESDDSVFWICGTNYLEKYEGTDDNSYMFTKHLLPCGWASWDKKFLKYYDNEFKLYNITNREEIKKTYYNKALYKQQIKSIESEIYHLKKFGKPTSWDFQLIFTLRHNNLFGISPKNNLIRNIGADDFSTHGGTSLNKIMTKRFCEIPTHKLESKLVHPKKIEVDKDYELKISNIILYPMKLRIEYFIKEKISGLIKPILNISKHESLSDFIKQKLKGRENDKS